MLNLMKAKINFSAMMWKTHGKIKCKMPMISHNSLTDEKSGLALKN